jgi:tetratricopeptide (TPR) repeat protein
MLPDISFERARRELVQGSRGAKVMDISLRSGCPHSGRFSVEYRRRYGETPSQTLKRQTVFVAALAAMPSSFVPFRDGPTVALSQIEAAAEHLEIAANLADDLALALTRAGISVRRQARSARYHLIGAIRGSGRQTRLIFRLIDNETGHQLWAHRSDGILGDAAEEHLATRVAAALQPCLRLAEIDHVLRKPVTDLCPDDLALRAMPGVLSLDAGGNSRALELLNSALEQDPKHALATALAAWAHIQRVIYHFSAEPQQERARSIELAQKARALSGDATVLAVLGNALTLLNELDTADLVIRKALLLDGGSAWAWSRSGWIDAYRGDPESAIERFKIALDLAPQDPLAFNRPGRDRLCAFRGGQLCRSSQMAAACADRTSVGELGTSNPVSRLFACRRQIRSPQKPRRATGAISEAHAVQDTARHAAAAVLRPCCRRPARRRAPGVGKLPESWLP